MANNRELSQFANTVGYNGGNIGIGTDIPGHLLDLYNSAGTDCFRLNVNGNASGTSKQNAIRFSVDGDVKAHMGLAVDAGRLISGSTANDFCIKGLGSNNILFATNSSEKLRIEADGQVVINRPSGAVLSNSSSKLEVYNSTNNVIFVSNSTAATGQDAGIMFGPANNVYGGQIIVTSDEDFSTSANRTAHMAFYTRNNGTASEKLRILSNGGITFNGDTATANALEDYEEGTWTCTLIPNSGFTPTSNTTTGYYTKIGRQVTVMSNAIMTIPSSLGSYVNNSTSYGLAVTGLPFTILNGGSQSRSAPVIGVADNIQFSGGTLSGHGSHNTTQISIFVNKDNGAVRTSPTLTASQSINFHFSFTYFV